MAITATYLVGIVGGIALGVGLFSAWRRAKRSQGDGQPSRSRAVELQKEALISTGSPVSEDEALRAEFAALKNQTVQTDRDSLLESLVPKAVAVGDWWLAMESAEAISSNLGKDKALKEIVDAAIEKKEWCLAALAADKMFYKNFQDQAKQRLVDEAGEYKAG